MEEGLRVGKEKGLEVGKRGGLKVGNTVRQDIDEKYQPAIFVDL
jgi:hypothetical protein